MNPTAFLIFLTMTAHLNDFSSRIDQFETNVNQMRNVLNALRNLRDSQNECTDTSGDTCEYCLYTIKDLQRILDDDTVQTVMAALVCQYFPYQTHCTEYIKEFLQDFVDADTRHVCETLYMCQQESQVVISGV
jgi:hypothetical protein